MKLTIEQMQEMRSIQPDEYVSVERIRELNWLISAGYPASAIICAICEAVYAAKNNIVIPATERSE